MFESLFHASKGQPVEYKGRRLYLADSLEVSPTDRLVVRFESWAGRYRQGIALKTDGHFRVNGQVVRKALLLWRDTAPTEVSLEVSSKDGTVLIHNVWDHGDGVVQAWHNGAAMAIDNIDHTTRRYSCNDGEPDDDLDDLVFTVRRSPPA